MNAENRRTLSMVRRALDYANAHPIDKDGYKIALQRLDTAVTEATGLGLQETGGEAGQRSGVAQRRAARSRIRQEFLIRAVRVGQQAAESNRALMGVFVLPEASEPNKAFLLHARTILEQATEHQAVLLPLGLDAAFVAELGAAIVEFENVGTSIDTGRGQHVSAAKSYRPVLARCRSIISQLDTFYRAAYPAGNQVLEGWLNARDVEGPFTHHRTVTDTPNAEAPPAPAPLGGDASRTGTV